MSNFWNYCVCKRPAKKRQKKWENQPFFSFLFCFFSFRFLQPAPVFFPPKQVTFYPENTFNLQETSLIFTKTQPFYAKSALVYKKLICAIFCILLAAPVFSKGRREQAAGAPSPVEVYYAGQIEEAIRLLSASRAAPDQKAQLAALYWEIGEMGRAARLLGELLENRALSPVEKDNFRLELFVNYSLIGNYAQAALMRGLLEPAAQRMDRRTRAEFYFHNAWIYHEMGYTEMAAKLYRQSLYLNRWRPIAWYRLGHALLESDPAEAERAFQTAWNQDRAFTTALPPLAWLLAERGEWEAARDHLIVANARLPEDRAIRDALAEARRHAPGAPDDGMHLIRRQITAIPPTVTPAPPTPGMEPMRIGLIENRRLFSVRAGGSFTIRDVQSRNILHTGAAGEQFWVEWNRNGTLTVSGVNNRAIFNSSTPIVHELDNNHYTSIVAGVVNAAPGTNRIYRGSLEFRPGPNGITVVNIVHLEDYLYGVVPAEMPATWPMEALKVQAIAARSYAIAYRGRFAYRGFDIFGTPHSQAYGGVGIEHRNSTAAVDATRGIILVGESGQPLSAYYSANHGGHSEDSLVMWGYAAYMQAVADRQLPVRDSFLPPMELFRWLREEPAAYSNVPGFVWGATYRWERWITPQEIRRRLILDRRVAQDPGEIIRIVSRGRGISGRIPKLEVQGSLGNVIVRGDAVWFTMGGLRSSLFFVRYKLNADGGIQYIIFHGAGYGHGMGMDQMAAAGMASRGGMGFEEILLHWYPRATLQNVSDVLTGN